MTDVLLFHHAQGLTPGVHSFAERLRDAGHVVHTPDLYDGATFPSVDAGVAHAKAIGFDVILERGRRAAGELIGPLVFAGFSLGVLPAQQLAQTTPGARGALLLHGCVPVTEFSPAWPAGVPVQIHAMADDPWFAEDVDVARDLVASVEGAELFLYPGSGHLFADDSVADYDPAATALLIARVLSFLGGVA
ncbi:MAG: dienelactone hydrolase family protein [Acidimicrobiales bacterium]